MLSPSRTWLLLLALGAAGVATAIAVATATARVADAGRFGPLLAPEIERLDVHQHVLPDTAAEAVRLSRAHGIDTFVNLQGGTADGGLQRQLEAAEDGGWAGAGANGNGGRPSAGGTGAATAPISERERKRLEAEARNARYQRERPLRDEIARLEQRIAELEATQKTSEAALADPPLYADFARARPHVDPLAAAKGELETLYARWEEAHAKLEALSG